MMHIADVEGHPCPFFIAEGPDLQHILFLQNDSHSDWTILP